MQGRRWIVVGGLFAAAAVLAGAFGAHGLKERLTPDKLQVFETAARYQMYHALALVLVGLVANAGARRSTANLAGFSFVLGIAFFCGWLYAAALSSATPPLPLLAPIGGLAFVVGWLALACSAVRRND
jgi:uncharacterized membrane protein YgdD (TMEM256/DUF423 family)